MRGGIGEKPVYMEDIFYFTRQPIQLDELKAIIAGLGYETARFTAADAAIPIPPSGQDALRSFNVYWPPDPRVFWSWAPTDTLAVHGDAALLVLKQYGYATEYTISLRNEPWSIDPLRALLRQLLQTYGGWIGMDTETLEPTYGLETLDQLAFPLYGNSR
jgi:hypothetical protein